MSAASAARLDRPQDDPHHDRADHGEHQRAEEALRGIVADAPDDPASDDGAEDPHDDRRQAALDAPVAAHEPTREPACEQAEDDPAAEAAAGTGPPRGAR